MLTVTPYYENDIIRTIAADFPRHPLQVNKLLEADAEIIKWKQLSNDYLVVKTDSIAEEISSGLYQDPYLLGWMSVTAPISDVAAVGGVPFGILLSVVLDEKYSSDWLQSFKHGIKDACEEYKVYVLGGDTNFSAHCIITCTALATAPATMMRSGMNAGDLLFTTGMAGAGSAFAYHVFFDRTVPVEYQPLARISESKSVLKYASSCIDTSDGLFPALAVLAEVNDKGFQLTVPSQELLKSDVARISSHSGVPGWMMLAGPHGDYELLFTIPQHREDAFIQECKMDGWHPIRIGEVTRNAELSFT